MESIYIADARAPSADAAEGASSFLEKRPPRFPLTVSGDLPLQRSHRALDRHVHHVHDQPAAIEVGPGP